MYKHQLDRIEKDIKAHKPHKKWEYLFPNEDINWEQIHQIPFKCTIDSKLRNFQYKFLMRIVATNKFLFLCNRSASNLCEFCSRQIETQMHLFIQCDIIQDFWNQLQNYLTQKNLTTVISNVEKCFGRGGKENELIDFIIICAKYYIHSCKYKVILPHLDHFKSILKYRCEIEKIITINLKFIIKNGKNFCPLTLIDL